MNYEQDVPEAAPGAQTARGLLRGGAAARPTAGAAVQVQSLRLSPIAVGGPARAGSSPSPRMGASPAHALVLLNSSSLGHRGKYGALPSISNLLPHGPFSSVPADGLDSCPGSGGGSGVCSPFRPAAASSRMVPSPQPPGMIGAAPAVAVLAAAVATLPQQVQQAQQQTVLLQQQDCWPAFSSAGALQQRTVPLPPPLPPQLPPLLPPSASPVRACLGRGSGQGAGLSQCVQEAAEGGQQPYDFGCFDMDFEFSLDFSSGMDSLGSEISPDAPLGLHALMDDVQENGDALTSTLLVPGDIFKPLPLHGAGNVERERLAQQAARALRLLHGDTITPSPENTPLMPLHPSLCPQPPVLAAPVQQQQQQQQQQWEAALQQPPAAQPVPPAQQPANGIRSAQVSLHSQAPSTAGLATDAPVMAVTAHTKALPLNNIGSAEYTNGFRHLCSRGCGSSSGSDGSMTSNCRQPSSSGSQCSGSCDANGDGSEAGVAALMALCCIANPPDGCSVPVKPEPPEQAAFDARQQMEQPLSRPQRLAPQRAQRARRQAQQGRQQAQQGRQQTANRKPRKLSRDGSSGCKKLSAAKLGVERGSIRKMRSAPASSPAAKCSRVATTAARVWPAPSRKAAGKPPAAQPADTKLAGKAAGGGKGRKPDPKRTLTIELLEAEGCFEMQQDKAAAHMGFGKTWFKEAIKKLGIERWPYRQLSTLKQSVLLPLEEAIEQHGRLCSPRRAAELLAAVRAEYAAMRDRAMQSSTLREAQPGQDGNKEELLSSEMRGLRQDIAYKPRNEAKRAADEGGIVSEEKLARDLQRVVHKWHAKLCRT